MLVVLLIIIALIFGGITSYTDIKTGKIRNKHVNLFLIVGFLTYLLISLNLMFKGAVNLPYFKEVFWQLVFSAILGYFFWVIGVWTPGDGKLFTVFAFLLPLEIYKFGYIKNFSSYNILVNTFTPLFLFLFVNILTKSSKKKKLEALKKSLTMKIVATTAFGVFSFSWLISLVANYVGVELNHFTSTVFMLILFIMTEKIFMGSSMKITVVLVVARIFLDTSWISYAFFFDLIFLVLLFTIFRYFILELGFNLFSKDIKVEDLKPGMVMAEVFYEENETVQTKKAVFMSLFSYFKEKTNNNLIDYKSEGLTSKDINKIIELQKENPKLQTVAVLDILPFAPFMFGGILLTLIFQGNIVLFLQSLL